MASSGSRDQNVPKTRLLSVTEKRKAEEQLNHETELNRQRKLFAPEKVTRPRDILATSNPPPNIKLEECSPIIVKQETFEAESIVIEPNDLLVIKPEVDNSLVVKVEETLDLDTTVKEEFSEHIQPIQPQENLEIETVISHMFASTSEQNDNLPNLATESEQETLSQNRELVEQNEKEIGVLIEWIERLQLRLSNLVPNPSTTEMKEINSNSLDNVQVVSKLPADQKDKNLKMNELSHRILQLQCKLFQSLPDPHLKKVLPVLYPEFQLNDTYDNRNSCDNWQTAAKKFVADIGHIPTWKVPPLQILAKTYKFTDLSELDNYMKKRNHNMSCSTVWFDNISIENRASLRSLKTFFATFGDKIKYFKIRQCVDLRMHYMDSKAEQLMDFIKFCLERLPNLAGFTFVLRNGTDKSKGSNYWKYALKDKTQTNDHFRGYTFPKLEHLESVVIDYEYFSTFVFMKYLVSSLTDSYSNQLKQLSLVDSGDNRWNIESLVVSSLIELTIRQNLLGKMELGCQNVEKCTILDYTDDLKHDDVILIQTTFPKLTCLRFKFNLWRSDFHDSLWTMSTPTLPSVVTLELQFCRSVTFTLLRVFPNLRYLKLLGVCTQKLSNDPYKTSVLDVWKLLQNVNLYKSHQFWKQFPNISLVTVELGDSTVNAEPVKSLAPKLWTYTREGYVRYCSSNCQE